jgi:hypothetical protein
MYSVGRRYLEGTGVAQDEVGGAEVVPAIRGGWIWEGDRTVGPAIALILVACLVYATRRQCADFVDARVLAA